MGDKIVNHLFFISSGKACGLRLAEDGLLGRACGWHRCRLPLHHQVAGEVDKDPKVRVEKENVAEKGKEVEK